MKIYLMNKNITYEQINTMITNVANDTTNEIIHLLTDDLHVKIANVLSNKIVDIL